MMLKASRVVCVRWTLGPGLNFHLLGRMVLVLLGGGRGGYSPFLHTWAHVRHASLDEQVENPLL